jgi:glycosyltransferase involved in cell wall biosynthesis
MPDDLTAALARGVTGPLPASGESLALSIAGHPLLAGSAIERGAAPTLRQISFAGTRPLSVLHVFKYFRPDFTGEGLYLEKLAPWLARLGITSSVMATITVADAATRYPAEIGTPRLFGHKRLPGPAAKVPPALWVARNASRFDVVHFHSPVSRHFTLQGIAKLSGCRVVQTCTLNDGLGTLVASYRRSYRGMARRLCGLIDDVVAISPKLHDDSLAVLPASRVHLIPQGVRLPTLDEAGRAALRARWGFAEADTVLLFVGAICARKDVRFLALNHPAAATGCAAAGATGRLRLLLVGPDQRDAYAAELRQLVASLPCRADVTFVPYLDDPSPAYRVADAFVFASREEGFGNVLLEAMSFGLPVVSRRLPGVTDSIIAHGRTGFLFETAEEYCRAIVDLAARPDLRRTIGAAARRDTALRFDLARIAVRYDAVYRGMQ